MIQSSSLRWTVILALLLFAVFMIWTALVEGGTGTVIMIALGLVALTAAVGFAFPGRQRIALRVVAGAITLAYLAYFGEQLFRLIRGEPQEFKLGQPSATMAILGLLVWGIPMLVYALSGRTSKERRLDDALAADESGELADERALSALYATGVDPKQSTPMRFILSFPSEAHARSAQNVAQREEFEVMIHADEDAQGAWVCEVSRCLPPAWEDVRAVRARLTDLARDLGGRFVGWEAEV